MTIEAPCHSALTSNTLAKLVVTSVFPKAIGELTLCLQGLDHCIMYTEPSKIELGCMAAIPLR